MLTGTAFKKVSRKIFIIKTLYILLQYRIGKHFKLRLSHLYFGPLLVTDNGNPSSQIAPYFFPEIKSVNGLQGRTIEKKLVCFQLTL